MDELWQESYWFFCYFKKNRWYNVFLFFMSFNLLLLIISDDTISERWKVTCLIKLLTDKHLFVIEVWQYTFSSTKISVNCIPLVSLWNAQRPMWCQQHWSIWPTMNNQLDKNKLNLFCNGVTLEFFNLL